MENWSQLQVKLLVKLQETSANTLSDYPHQVHSTL